MVTEISKVDDLLERIDELVGEETPEQLDKRLERRETRDAENREKKSH